jgi:hypothetical protein
LVENFREYIRYAVNKKAPQQMRGFCNPYEIIFNDLFRIDYPSLCIRFASARSFYLFAVASKLASLPNEKDLQLSLKAL